jgi:hypothetical protein
VVDPERPEGDGEGEEGQQLRGQRVILLLILTVVLLSFVGFHAGRRTFDVECVRVFGTPLVCKGP